MKWIRSTIVWLLSLMAFLPLVLSNDGFFPFVAGKLYIFRSVLALVLILLCVAGAWHLVTKKKVGIFEVPFGRMARSPFFWALCLFVGSLILSTVLALNPYRAFWGNIERGEGFVGIVTPLIFLILTVLIFKASNWIRFLKMWMVSGFITFLYAFFQFVGFTKFPLAFEITPRPGSFLGNSAFFAVFALFVLIFAVIVLLKSSRKNFWWWASGAMGILSAIFIFISGTRGVILGLGAGIFVYLLFIAFSRGGKKMFVWGARGVLILGIIFAGVFWTTRSASLWQHIPGLSRLAQTTISTGYDSSTGVRLITWNVSWQGFLDKPIIGWGLEHYIIAYQKHYDPEYSIYSETWLDRAHNKIFDVLVTQGLVGILSYLLFLGVFVWMLFSKKVKYRKIILAGFVAYFVQNLVLFDQIISYLTLYTLMGFAWHFVLERNKELGQEDKRNTEESLKFQVESKKGGVMRGVGFVGLVAVAVGSVWYIWAYNWIPYAQARSYRSSVTHQNIDDVVAALRRGMYPFNFAQFDIRAQGLDVVYLNQYFFNDQYRQNEHFKPLGDLLVSSTEELAARYPNDVRLLIREAEMFDALAYEDPSWYPKIEAILRHTLELAPERQDVYYHLAVNLAKQEKFDESIALARRALDLAPNAGRSRFYLGLVLAGAGKNVEAQKEIASLYDISDPFLNFLPGDFNSLLMLYEVWGNGDGILKLVNESVAGSIGSLFEQHYYILALGSYVSLQDASGVERVGSFVADHFSSLADDMHTIIDLAQKGKWTIIQNL